MFHSWPREVYISKTIAIEEAPYAAQTIFDYRSNSRACAEYEGLAEEVERRIAFFEDLFSVPSGGRKRVVNA